MRRGVLLSGGHDRGGGEGYEWPARIPARGDRQQVGRIYRFEEFSKVFV